MTVGGHLSGMWTHKSGVGHMSGMGSYVRRSYERGTFEEAICPERGHMKDKGHIFGEWSFVQRGGQMPGTGLYVQLKSHVRGLALRNQKGDI